ncbi:glycosyl hydrolase 115 family protein [Saccharicrinis fermentans]|uniref:glycosyl hydrolase 115 family protein n=1 Tax=Saccharicrinis fermentans TaxID=982 RepID=UPI0004BC6C2A|nr:glycosyl hydrolase 115 family protein [Saccharicrinis fermentans]
MVCKLQNMTSKLLYLLIGIFLFNACTASVDDVYLVQGDHATDLEKNAIQDLKKDLMKVTNKNIEIFSESEDLPENGILYLLGTIDTHQKIAQLADSRKISLSNENPGPRGGIWAQATLENGRKAIVLAGSDVQGLQYAIYDYSSEVLGIDPLEYWTGKTANMVSDNDLLVFENRSIAPPEIPILCYFENDVDELANYRGKLLEYDWETYTEMINSLVRLKYNAIQLFDMLGRPEFFLREAYQKLKPDYDIDIKYIEKLIDYAHLKGMKVQIDMSLGYKLYQLNENEASCWKENKEKWIEAWTYYLEKTPVGKCDIFSLRPRNQVWDWEYKSTCGEDKTEVFNEVYAEFGKLIDRHNPDAVKVLICYHDGMEIFNKDFNPPKDFIVAWSDNGWLGFEYLPESTKGYNFGTYMHAGFWRNHTVPDPCPELIDETMTHFIDTYGANKYLQVNGQTFRLFILNITAFSKVAQSYKDFDGEDFYRKWTRYYFGEDAAEYVVSAYKHLHQAQLNEDGYVEILYRIKMYHQHLKTDALIENSESYQRAFSEDLNQRMAIIDSAWEFVEKGKELDKSKAYFYHDQVELPVLLIRQLLNYQFELQNVSLARDRYQKTGNKLDKQDALEKIDNARMLLEEHIATRMRGDMNPKWKNWYNPAIRRPNNGFPELEDLLEIKNVAEEL